MSDQATELSAQELGHLLSHYDGWTDVNAQHWHEITEFARATCPVAHSEANGGFWIVSSNQGAREVLGDPQTFSSRDGTQIPVEDRIRKPPQDMDPPLQSDFRRLLNRYFSLRGLEPYRPVFEDIVHAQVDSLMPPVGTGVGRFEVIADFARPITTQILCRVIFNLDDPEVYGALAATTARLATGGVEANARTFAQLQGQVTELLDDLAGRAPQDDVLDAVLHGMVAGRPLTRTEQIGTILQLLLGGLKTTVSAIANIVHNMTTTPGLEDELRRPDWTQRYLDEFLRYESPIKMVGRRVMRDTTVLGRDIPAGDMVAVLIGSANRDETVFDDAGALCPDRTNNPHVTFGLGVHRCIGSNLARVEISSALDILLRRAGHLRPAGTNQPVRATSQVELVWEAVEVEFDRLD